MKLAIMQPYLFPYIGYFQLLGAVDKFIYYDDVKFIKQGWINRNSILVAGAKHTFSVPIRNVSSFANIKDTNVDDGQYSIWCVKFMKTLEQNYRKAPQFSPTLELVRNVLSPNPPTIAAIAISSIEAVANYLGMESKRFTSSTTYSNSELKAVDRVLDICAREQATEYYNAIGGTEIYDKDVFAQKDITLKFVKSREIRYSQGGGPFVPWLSMIDVLMYNDRDSVRALLGEYDLV